MTVRLQRIFLCSFQLDWAKYLALVCKRKMFQKEKAKCCIRGRVLPSPSISDLPDLPKPRGASPCPASAPLRHSSIASWPLGYDHMSGYEEESQSFLGGLLVSVIQWLESQTFRRYIAHCTYFYLDDLVSEESIGFKERLFIYLLFSFIFACKCCWCLHHVGCSCRHAEAPQRAFSF